MELGISRSRSGAGFTALDLKGTERGGALSSSGGVFMSRCAVFLAALGAVIMTAVSPARADDVGQLTVGADNVVTDYRNLAAELLRHSDVAQPRCVPV